MYRRLVMSRKIVQRQQAVAVVTDGVTVGDNTQVVAIEHISKDTRACMVANLLRAGCAAVQAVIFRRQGAGEDLHEAYERNMKSLQVPGEKFSCEFVPGGKEMDDLDVITITRTVTPVD